MGATCHCTNISCNFPGEGSFEMKLNSESIMDANNFATVFCPFCKEPMMVSELLTIRKRKNIDTEGDPLHS